MKFKDYINETRDNAIYVIECGDYDDILGDTEELMDSLLLDDAVTGNGSGSFTFNAEEAEELVADLIWDPDFLFEVENGSFNLDTLIHKDPETVDVIARCFALGYIQPSVEDAAMKRMDVVSGYRV